MPHMESIGERIRKARGYACLSQSDLARAVGVSRPQVYKWESGRDQPGADKLETICQILKVSLDWLLTGSEEGPVHRLAISAGNVGAAVRDAGETVAGSLRAGAENLPLGFAPVETKSASRRDELPVYHIERIEARGRGGVPSWLNLAAGPGGPLELTENMLYFRELPERNGWHSAIIRGDSMAPTILPGDVVLLETILDGKGLVLGALNPGDPKSDFHSFRRSIHLDDIYVLQLNDDDPTLKRVRADSRLAGDWHLTLIADNLDFPGYPRVTGRSDTITFFARVIGITPASEYTEAMAKSGQIARPGPKIRAKT